MLDGKQRSGQTTLQRHGPEFYRRIGHKGGTANLRKHGQEFYSRIGRAGGQATALRGPDYYAEIGRKGGRNGKGSRKASGKQLD